MDNTNLKLLIVDDEEDLCIHAKSFFERRKFTVCTSLNAKEALNIARQQNPQIILLDFMLPDLTGLELLRVLRKEGISSKVIMITGHIPYKTEEDQFKELNVFKYLSKPVSLEKLEEAVKQALEIK